MTKGDIEDDLKSIILMLKSQPGDGKDVNIPSDKVPALLEIAEYELELVQMAQYRRARSLLVMQWRGLVIGAAATITAVSVILGSPVGVAIKSIWQVK